MHPQPHPEPTAKLIRDHVPDLMAATGQRCAFHLADPVEHAARPRDKLLAEAAEAAAAASPAALLDELGDVLEVCYALAAHTGSSPAEIERARAGKTAVRGGFARGVIWHGPQPDHEGGAA
jgi:predicted house-cleaning noncanonical NTP pyrophosphatase (MazG superfamily)